MKKILAVLLPLGYLLLLLFQKDLAMMGDLGRHLKVGEVVLQCKCVPQTNLFSYTHPDFQIVNHEWLGEVIFYLVSSSFGIQALLVFKMILVVTAAALVYSTATQKSSLFWVTIFSLLSITVFSSRFHVLPELYSYVFIGLFIFIIDRYQHSKNLRWLFLLPFLEMLWVNMHLYFVLGVAMYGYFLLEELILKKKLDKKVLAIGMAIALATLINPSFIRGAILPFTVFHNYGFPVEENKSLSEILHPTSTNNNIAYTFILQIVVFEILALTIGAILFVKKQWKEIFHMSNAATGVVLGFKFTRCLSLLGLFGLTPLSQAFTNLETSVEKRFGHISKITFQVSAALLVASVLLIHVKGLHYYSILHFGFEPSAEKAANFLQDTSIQGKIFNNYIIGNYLIYRLYPNQQVFIDARPEAYPAVFFDEYWRMIDDANFFNEQVQKYDINAVVFNVSMDDPVKIRPFFTSLIYSQDWVPVYADGKITILVRNWERNASVIEKFRISIHENESSK